MGTRAQFFIGDPQDVEGREWLGCVAWDGYPDGDVGDTLKEVTTVEQFRQAITGLMYARDDFCDPATNSFPFPWKDDLFLTDCTYAWYDNAVQFTYFHRGFMPLKEYLALPDDHEDEHPDKLLSNVPAPTSGKPPGPDSIMILRALP
jgi:hypothetical protein